MLKNNCTCKCHVSQSACCGECEEVELTKSLFDKKDAEINDRLIRLEECVGGLVNKLNINTNNHEERIENLEKYIHPEALLPSLIGIINRLEILENFWNHGNHHNEKRVYKCPVCEGKGKDKDKLVAVLPIDGSMHRLEQAYCDACEGKGILWK